MTRKFGVVASVVAAVVENSILYVRVQKASMLNICVFAFEWHEVLLVGLQYRRGRSKEGNKWMHLGIYADNQ